MLWKSNAQLAPGREGESDRIEHTRQPRAIEIPLDQLVAAEPTVGTTVEPLPEWLSRVGATRMTILRELGLMSRDLMQLGGASSCNHALDGVYKAPRGTQPHASAKAALPAFVADLFNPQIIAQADDLVGESTMQAAPVRGQFALRGRQAPAGLLIAVTLPPHASPLALSFFDAALCIVVLGVVGPALPLQVALQPAALACIGRQFLGQEQQARRADLGDNGQRRGPQIESHRPFARPVCGFLQGMTFQDELHRVYEAPTVSSLCLGRGGWLAQQAHVLDALPQPMVDDFVLPVDQGGDLLAVPAQPALVPFRCRLQMEAQARGVGLALHRVQASSLAAEADTTRLAHTDSIGRLVGPTRYLLRHEAVDVRSKPAGAQAFGRLVQAVFREAIARAQTSEGLRACGFVSTGNAASSLPGRIGFHAFEALHRLGKQGIVELAGAFKVSMQLGRLLRVHPQGQGEAKRGRWLVSHAHSIENILSKKEDSTTRRGCQAETQGRRDVQGNRI
jgi:hypothetical protein